MFSKKLLLIIAYESYGESPFTSLFRYCCAPLVGLLKSQYYAQQYREKQRSNQIATIY